VLLRDGTEGLLAGYRYTYRFEVVLERDGQRLSDTQVVQVHAGNTVTVELNHTDKRIAQRYRRLPWRPLRSTVKTSPVPPSARSVLTYPDACIA
jgi:hypothetical protein